MQGWKVRRGCLARPRAQIIQRDWQMSQRDLPAIDRCDARLRERSGLGLRPANMSQRGCGSDHDPGRGRGRGQISRPQLIRAATASEVVWAPTAGGPASVVSSSYNILKNWRRFLVAPCNRSLFVWLASSLASIMEPYGTSLFACFTQAQ